MHGGGWVLGNAGTHDRLVREVAVGANAALAFVEYPNSPEARYPVAIEQGTRPRDGSPAKAYRRDWIPAASRSPASRSAAT
jgi:hypothetical protein